MSSAPSKKVATLDTGLSLNPADAATLKPKVLREHLKRSMNVLSDDWHLHLIVEVLAEAYGCDIRAVTHGVRVTKGAGETTEFSFRKGTFTDKATKKLAKFFYHNEDLLRRYVGALDLAIGAASKKPLVLSGVYGVESSEDGGEETTEFYLRLMNKKDTVFVTEDNPEYQALVGNSLAVNGAVIAVLLLKRIATRYGLNVYTSDTTSSIDGKGDDVYFVSFAVLE